MKEFKDILKELRKKEGLSQEALANIIHVSRSAIAKYENGLGYPSQEIKEELLNYFNVAEKDLFPLVDAREVIVKNKKIRTHKILLLISVTTLIILTTFLGIDMYIRNRLHAGGIDIVTAEKLGYVPYEDAQFFTYKNSDFGYRNTYRNEDNDFILKPAGQLWSVNGIPDFFMGYYNANGISLFAYINPSITSEVLQYHITDNGKYCFDMVDYGRGFNFMLINNTHEDINIKQLEFWC